jgi:hypothetical protein
LGRRDQRDAFEEQKKRTTPTAVEHRQERQIVVSRYRIVGDTLCQNLIGISLQQRFDHGQAFVPWSFRLVGQGDLSQYRDQHIGSVCMRHPVVD